jgi:hypothetical protein
MTEEKEYREGNATEAPKEDAPQEKPELMFFVYRTESGMVMLSPDVSKFGIRMKREPSIHEMTQMCSDALMQLNNIRIVNEVALITRDQLKSLYSAVVNRIESTKRTGDE